jgi:hypothetical protein
MWALIVGTIRESTLYYVQRQPQELGEIAWIIDRKDRTMTQMEETWSTLILPMGENAFGKNPLGCIEGGAYSYFDATYGFTKDSADPEMRRHMEWLDAVYKESRTEEGAIGIDAKRLLTKHRIFEDSRNSVGLQLADMLAAVLRRALNGRLQFDGWKDFGRLLIRHHNPGEGFIQLGAGRDISRSNHAEKVCRALDSKAKSMLLRV